MFGNYLKESELEYDVAKFCERQLAGGGSLVVRRFGVDIAIFRPSLCQFIEVKAFDSLGRCGFGDSVGGTQVNIFWDYNTDAPRTKDQLSLFDRYVRWLLCKKDLPVASDRFAFFDCSQGAQAVMGGIRLGKQNNFKASQLTWITDDDLEARIRLFLA